MGLLKTMDENLQRDTELAVRIMVNDLGIDETKATEHVNYYNSIGLNGLATAIIVSSG